ncbi:hypothetical protein NMY22_g17446 [Coprinellus aureogranulatus]|nr:hypothetical protein NMY22_g17446 [Coprinellus aureogranulatus]
MNEFYEDDRARDLLRNFRQEALVNEFGVLSPFVRDLNLADVFVTDVKHPPSMRLSAFDQERDTAVDVRLRIQGVLCSKSLGPFVNPPGNPSFSNLSRKASSVKSRLDRLRSLRQYVKLTALGEKEIDGDFKKLGAVWDLFSQHATGKDVPPMNFIGYVCDDAIDIQARYFMDKSLAPDEPNIPFKYSVDPYGVLSNIQPRELIHGTDNYVEYCRRIVDKDGQMRYEECSPGVFQVGDIVEAAFTVIGTLESELFHLENKRKRIEDAILQVQHPGPKRVHAIGPAVYLPNSAGSVPLKRMRSKADEDSTVGVNKRVKHGEGVVTGVVEAMRGLSIGGGGGSSSKGRNGNASGQVVE